MDYLEVLAKTADIPSHVLEAEQMLWYETLNGADIKTIVDFGTGWGKSAKTLALICPQAKVLTMENAEYHMKCGIVKTYNEFFGKVEDYLKGVKNITVIVGSSIDQHPKQPHSLLVRQIFGVQQFDVLNLDSEWLSEDHTRKEMAIWLPLLKTGGYLFAHDWRHNKSDAVRKVLEGLIRENKIKLLKEADCEKYAVGLFEKL